MNTINKITLCLYMYVRARGYIIFEEKTSDECNLE
jgi:hypothetical protein